MNTGNTPIGFGCRILKLFMALFFSTSFLHAEENVCSFNAKDWCVFVTKPPQRCYIASQALEMKAFRNGELLADVNREKGILFINVERGESGSIYANYDAGYPLRKNGHVEMIVGGKVFRLYPDPEASGNLAEYAWHVEEDDKKIVDSLKAGSQVTIEAISKRGTKTKDTFSLLGLTAAIIETKKLCN